MLFNTCERAAAELLQNNKTTEFENIIQVISYLITLVKIFNQPNYIFNYPIKTPTDAFLRTFIMTIGEFGSLYKEMASCDSLMMRNLGKVVGWKSERSLNIDFSAGLRLV